MPALTLIALAAVMLSYAVADALDTLAESITWRRCIQALVPAAEPARRSLAFTNPDQLPWVPETTHDKLSSDTIRARWRAAQMVALAATIVSTALYAIPTADIALGAAVITAILALSVSMALAVLSAGPEVRRTLRAVERAYCAHHGVNRLPTLTKTGRHVDPECHPVWWLLRG